MGADEYHWVKTVLVVETPGGIEISWDCVWHDPQVPETRLYRVQYANALSLGMTWNTFGYIIDGGGWDRVSYLDTTAGGLTTRIYRVTKLQ